MRALLLACSLLLLAAASANAGGTHLRWNACSGDGGVVNRSFACDTNTGSELLACSFTLDVPVDSVYALNAFVNMAFAGGVLPAWWQFRTVGSCRAASLSTSLTPPAGAAACVDWADGARDILLIYHDAGSGLARIEALTPVLSQPLFDLPAGQEFFVFSAVINHQKTVGTGACAGCDLGGCMGFVGLRLLRTATTSHGGVYAGDYFTGPADISNQVVTWQNGAGIAIPNYLGAGWIYCPGATPARNRTWGDVKALYR